MSDDWDQFTPVAFDKSQGLQPQFAQQAQHWLDDMKSQGYDPKIVQGYRTNAEQANLYAKYKAGGPLAAPPGSSKHEIGQALDWVNRDPDKSLKGDKSLQWDNDQAYAVGQQTAAMHGLQGLGLADNDHIETATPHSQAGINWGDFPAMQHAPVQIASATKPQGVSYEDLTSDAAPGKWNDFQEVSNQGLTEPFWTNQLSREKMLPDPMATSDAVRPEYQGEPSKPLAPLSPMNNADRGWNGPAQQQSASPDAALGKILDSSPTDRPPSAQEKPNDAENYNRNKTALPSPTEAMSNWSDFPAAS